jgi:hypothetical protein
MQPLMHCLEVTLRNAIDYSIRHARLPGAAGHWRTDTNWIFDLPRYIGEKTWIRQNKRYKTDARGQKLMHHGNRFMTGQPGRKTVSVRCQNVSVLRARRRRQSG